MELTVGSIIDFKIKRGEHDALEDITLMFKHEDRISVFESKSKPGRFHSAQGPQIWNRVEVFVGGNLAFAYSSHKLVSGLADDSVLRTIAKSVDSFTDNSYGPSELRSSLYHTIGEVIIDGEKYLFGHQKFTSYQGKKF